ncbi:hypothetical protein ACFWN1_32950, partial [Streptomyces sp. NPDC058459]|uniref:hypothetical protein n=1 Tax=Streptomyces sp. NPDC058459 TaxID=3346508 RepID=UPI003651907C
PTTWHYFSIWPVWPGCRMLFRWSQHFLRSAPQAANVALRSHGEIRPGFDPACQSWLAAHALNWAYVGRERYSNVTPGSVALPARIHLAYSANQTA